MACSILVWNCRVVDRGRVRRILLTILTSFLVRLYAVVKYIYIHMYIYFFAILIIKKHNGLENISFSFQSIQSGQSVRHCLSPPLRRVCRIRFKSASSHFHPPKTDCAKSTRTELLQQLTFVSPPHPISVGNLNSPLWSLRSIFLLVAAGGLSVITAAFRFFLFLFNRSSFNRNDCHRDRCG